MKNGRSVLQKEPGASEERTASRLADHVTAARGSEERLKDQEKEDTEMKFTWKGHSCFVVEDKGFKVAFDPFGDDAVPGYGKVRVSNT